MWQCWSLACKSGTRVGMSVSAAASAADISIASAGACQEIQSPHNVKQEADTEIVTLLDQSGLSLAILPDAEFWFEDGSIVIVSRLGDVGFRVYKRLLAEHSPIFRDIFSLPQPNQPAVESSWGCPVVVVDESPEQLRHLFRVIFPINGNINFGKNQRSVSMDALAAVIQLSHKYEIDQLLAQALSILTEYYTEVFEDWLNPDRETCLMVNDLGDSISAIGLARLTGTSSVLPLAYFHAGRIETKELDEYMRRSVCANHLMECDYYRILDGKFAVIKAGSQALARIFKPDVEDSCEQIDDECIEALKAKACVLDELLEKLYVHPTQIQTWADAFDDAEFEDGSEICPPCRAMVAARELEERKTLWEALPGIFGLSLDDWSAE
ncbi:hypothetical protein VTO73DRAFT_11929 [Trametes versicolor]